MRVVSAILGLALLAPACASSRPSDGHTERALGIGLYDRCSSGRSGHDARCVHHHHLVLHADAETIQATRRGTIPVLPRPVVFRPMAWTFEPLALLAEGHPTSQVGTLLVQGAQAIAAP